MEGLEKIDDETDALDITFVKAGLSGADSLLESFLTWLYLGERPSLRQEVRSEQAASPGVLQEEVPQHLQR